MEKQALREKTRLGQPKHAHIILPFFLWVGPSFLWSESRGLTHMKSKNVLDFLTPSPMSAIELRRSSRER